MSAPSSFGTNGYGCVGHRRDWTRVECPRSAIVETFGGKCADCKRSQVAANRDAFNRARGVCEAMDPTIRRNVR